MALSLTKGRVHQGDIAREATSAVADRLPEYFQASGVVPMRPTPRTAHSSNDLGINEPKAPRERRAMPDGPRGSYRATIRVEPVHLAEKRFLTTNTSGVDRRELTALNRALQRLVAAGLTKHEAKIAVDAAIRQWLESKDASDPDLERLLRRR